MLNNAMILGMHTVNKPTAVLGPVIIIPAAHIQINNNQAYSNYYMQLTQYIDAITPRLMTTPVSPPFKQGTEYLLF